MQTEQHLKWEAVQNNDRMTLQLTGALSRITLLPLYQQWQKRAQQNSVFASLSNFSSVDLDLSQLEQIDSAGFAFLCDMLNDVAKIQQVKIKNAPEQLHTLADLYGLSRWLQPFVN